jgi:putative ATP-binding cassette transporter
MKLLKLLFRYSPAMVVPAIFAGIFSGAANAALLGIVNTAFHKSDALSDGRLVWTFVGLCLLLPVARAGSGFLLSLLGQRLVLQLRLSLARKTFQAPLRQLEQIGQERMLATLTDDIGSLVGALSTLPTLFLHGTIVVGSLVYLGMLSLRVLGLVLVALVVGAAVYQLPRIRAKSFQRRAREEADRMWEHLGAVTAGMKELKLHHGRQEGMLADLEATGLRQKRMTVTTSTLFGAGAGFGQMMVFAVVGLVVFVVPLVEPTELKTLTGYALVLLYMMTPLDMIFESVPTLTRAGIALKRVEKLGLTLDEIPREQAGAPAATEQAAGAWESLTLEGVTHEYRVEGEEEPFTIGPVSLQITPGEVVFLVGGNGSGKTTLAKLIMGLYIPDDGRICVDGHPVSDVSRDAYRQRFSAVFSDFHLFDHLYGLTGPELDANAARYLHRLQLTHKVKVEGGRLSTTALSQGQRKRLALLTAYLEDRPLYVFDEWAADQDPTFKHLFYCELLPELKARGKAVLVISHDDHYYATADRILKMHQGQLEYDGPPEGLQYTLFGVASATGEA